MGADCTAAWLGVLLLTALSFVPANMASTWKAREYAGRLARLSLPASVFVALWTTLSTLQLTPPPGGVLLSLATIPLVIAVALSAWGVGLIVAAAAERWLGWHVPQMISLAVGAAAAAFVLVVR